MGSEITKSLIPDARYYQKGFKNALNTFKFAAKNVPAYKDFLQKHKIDYNKVNSREDFLLVPPITKANYLKNYPLKDLLINGSPTDSRIISMSSGSSGKPFFWCRGNRSVAESAKLLQSAYSHSFHADKKNTLCIIAFAMGTWIAGTYILTANNQLADQGFRIVSITPGINISEIIQIIDEIGLQFEQIVIAGYPPFIRDLFDEASRAEIALNTFNIKVLFAGENFSETFRDYMLSCIGSNNHCFDSVGIYGTADAGIVGIENPFSICLRRFLHNKNNLLPRVFPGTEILPSLVTYDPMYRYCEVVGNKIIFTTNNSMPLIRYNILDEGIILDGAKLLNLCVNNGMQLPALCSETYTRNLIAIYGRQDIATIFYSLNIYPENIKRGLEQPSIQQFITGKFVIKSGYRSNLSQELILTIELRPEIKGTKRLQVEIKNAIVNGLEQTNSEYRKLRSEIKQKADPRIKFLPFGSSEFNIKIKHKWAIKG